MAETNSEESKSEVDIQTGPKAGQFGPTAKLQLPPEPQDSAQDLQDQPKAGEYQKVNE